jgi:hypothetical protein
MNHLTIHNHPESNYLRAYKAPTEPQNLSSLSPVCAYLLFCRGSSVLRISTTVKNPLQIDLFMQNKPNLRKALMNVNSFITKDYERNDIFAIPENKANSNPIPPLVSSHLNSPNLDNIWLLFLLIQVLYGLKPLCPKKPRHIASS